MLGDLILDRGRFLPNFLRSNLQITDFQWHEGRASDLKEHVPSASNAILTPLASASE